MSLKEDFSAVAGISASQGRSGYGRSMAIAAAALICVILAMVSLWPMQAAVFNQEGGLFETVSAAALLAAGLAALWRYPGLSRLYIGLVCLLLAERELEADIYQTDSLPYWILNGLDTVLDITLVRAALALIVVGGVVWHGIPNAWRAFKDKAPFLLIFFLAGCAAVVAQGLEEVAGVLHDSLSATMLMRLFVLEETLEMFFSIGILAAVLIGWPKSEIKETSNDPELRPNLR
ncbi:MAG: hypothetical protein AB3N07_06915 [Ruegeria sp.]